MTYTVRKIKWDRIWIRFFMNETDIPASTSFYLVSMNGNLKFKLVPSEDDSQEFKINITNPGNCEMLPCAVYKLEAVRGGTEQKTVTGGTEQKTVAGSTEPEAVICSVLNPGRCNRQFVYFHSERAYRVQFSARNGFKIKTSDIRLKNQGIIKTLSSLIRRGRHNFAKMILRNIYNVEHLIFHRKQNLNAIMSRKVHEHPEELAYLYNLKNPRILLMSDQSEEMGSNMKALKDALIKKGYHPKEALRAITTKHYSVPHWIKTLKKIAEADFIFLDDHSQTTDWLTIKGTIITQLWHAGAGFKSTGYSRFGMPASPAPRSGHRQYAYGIAGSLKIRHFFSEVWGINDDMVLPAGMPRLDEYLDSTYRKAKTEELLRSYPMLCKPKVPSVILLAPTYRGENKRHAYYPYDKLDFDRLYTLCKLTNSVIIFKMHPFVEEPVPIPEECKDRMLDLGSYPNINDLFYVTDLLITDYSSNIYEFSLMRKPMLFYAFDIDEYTKERGFHRDYRTNVPGKIAETFDELYSAIETNDFCFEKVEEYISNNFEYTDSHACDRIIDWIIKGKS